MRVIFTGQTGINKDKIIDNIVRAVRRQRGFSEDSSNAESRKFLSAYKVESGIPGGKDGFLTWIQLDNPQVQLEDWRNGFQRILDKIEDEKPAHVFLSMHTVFTRYSRYFCPANWDLLRRFEPDLFITLIDDIYDIWWRIGSEANQFPPGGTLRLREILGWRSAEIMMTDTLAGNLFSGRSLNNYVVAVKHPIDMLLKLLLEPNAMRVYAAYPISRTKDYPDKRAEIDRHRVELHKRFVAFDPLSIDERVLLFLWNKREGMKRKPKKITFHRSERWPIPSDNFDFTLLSDGSEYPESIRDMDPVQIREIVKDIGAVDEHIVWRDFRLVNQAHCLAAYRPHYEGELSGGVAAEIDYARYSRTQVYQYFPEEDGSNAPFQNKGVLVSNYNQFLVNLERHEQQLRRDGITPSHQGTFD